MKNKILGVFLILFSFIGLSYYTINNVGNVIYQNEIINKKFINSRMEFLGYIEIKKLNIKKLIKEGTSNKILNKLYVGHIENSDSIDCEYGNIILAGHNTYFVFSKLKKLKINDEINLHSKNKIYKFKVIYINEIDKNNYKYFKKQYDIKILTLITCTNNRNKRLIIIAKKV